MTKEAKAELLKRAKDRCRHCPNLIEKYRRWWCDENDCSVEKVIDCREWEGDRGRI